MQTRLYNVWEKLKVSFWLNPALMVSCAIAAFFVLLNLDRSYQTGAFLFLSFLEPISATGARVILSTIAGSMITVAGTVFSITIVTLTLASTQFGPRLLRNFMQSTVNKVVLGSFISTFVYCLCALGSVEPAGRENFVPGLSVNFAVLLAFINVGILIYYIHHVATSIQVEKVIQNINIDLIKHIDAFFPSKTAGERDGSDSGESPGFPAVELESATQIVAEQFGYLQAIDKDALAKLAQQYDARFILLQRPGVYITRGMPLIAIDGIKAVNDQDCSTLKAAFLLGPQRTSEQDVEYSIYQLVEIAVRALSPGVNDPFTALACIDYLGAAVCRITDREFPSPDFYGDNKKICITFKTVSFSGIVGAAFDSIRQNGSESAAILIRLLEVLLNTIQLTEDNEQRQILARQAEMIHRSGTENLPEKFDRIDLDTRYEKIQRLAT